MKEKLTPSGLLLLLDGKGFNFPNPTLSLVQKWFREEWGIHIQPQKTFHNKTYSLGKIPIEFRAYKNERYKEPMSYMGPFKKKFRTYEEALEEGIKLALEHI